MAGFCRGRRDGQAAQTAVSLMSLGGIEPPPKRRGQAATDGLGFSRFMGYLLRFSLLPLSNGSPY